MILALTTFETVALILLAIIALILLIQAVR